jgi:hypothetical protein
MKCLAPNPQLADNPMASRAYIQAGWTVYRPDNASLNIRFDLPQSRQSVQQAKGSSPTRN